MTQNVLKNPGFESGMPDDWQTWDTGTKHKYIYPDIGRTKGSSVAVEYESKEEGKLAAWYQNIRVDPTKKYKVSGYVKTENIIGTGASIRVDWKDKDWQYLSRSEIMLRQNGSIPWTLFEGVVTPDPDAAVGVIILSLKDSSGKALFDDISFSLEYVPSLSRPNMYLNSSEIKAIKNKVNANQEPWKTAYNKLMNTGSDESYGSVGWAMNLPVQSVIFKGKICDGDKHNYCTDRPSGSSSDRNDYNAAISIGKAVRNLGLAYALTGEAKYADKAITLINAWCVNSDTRMNPRFTNFQSYIEICITIPGIFYGADLIWDYQGWDANNRQKFKDWTVEILADAMNYSNDDGWRNMRNNFQNWRLVFIASASVIADSVDSRNYAFKQWKDFISRQMNPNGSMKYELTRSTALDYSMYAINAMSQVAEIARHYGVDLYNYELSDGRGLEKALDFYTKYVSDPSAPRRWLNDGYKQDGGYNGSTNGNAQVYELAYTFKGKSTYKSCIDRWGRPMNEIRTMGPITLTHARGLEVTPGPVPAPEPVPGPGPAPEPVPGPEGYKLVWEDNFDEDSIGTNWFHAGGSNSDYAFVKDGNLHLKLDIIDESVKRGYVKSGSSSSNVKRFGPYGFFEVRAKVSNKIGVDNQCWLGMEGWGTPTGFEIDIFEYISRRKQYSMNFLAGENIGANWKGKNVTKDLNDSKYHLFQLEWTPDTYIFYLDGEVLWKFTDTDSSKNWIADKPGKMSLSLCGSYPDPGCSVQGVRDKIDDFTDLPTEFIIDYVRFYQKDN